MLPLGFIIIPAALFALFRSRQGSPQQQSATDARPLSGVGGTCAMHHDENYQRLFASPLTGALPLRAVAAGEPIRNVGRAGN